MNINHNKFSDLYLKTLLICSENIFNFFIRIKIINIAVFLIIILIALSFFSLILSGGVFVIILILFLRFFIKQYSLTQNTVKVQLLGDEILGILGYTKLGFRDTIIIKTKAAQDLFEKD